MEQDRTEEMKRETELPCANRQGGELFARVCVFFLDITWVSSKPEWIVCLWANVLCRRPNHHLQFRWEKNTFFITTQRYSINILFYIPSKTHLYFKHTSQFTLKNKFTPNTNTLPYTQHVWIRNMFISWLAPPLIRCFCSTHPFADKFRRITTTWFSFWWSPDGRGKTWVLFSWLY